MNKILKINEKDILFDYKEASEVINKACSRSRKMAVKGAFKFGTDLFVSLEGVDNIKKTFKYIIAPVDGISESELIAEINIRYMSNFSLITFFEIDSNIWGLYEYAT